MSKKFNIKQLSSFVFCLVAGVMAFVSERDNQRNDAKIEELEDRVSKLEETEES